jgi:hypothetical protein
MNGAGRPLHTACLITRYECRRAGATEPDRVSGPASERRHVPPAQALDHNASPSFRRARRAQRAAAGLASYLLWSNHPSKLPGPNQHKSHGTRAVTGLFVAKLARPQQPDPPQHRERFGAGQLPEPATLPYDEPNRTIFGTAVTDHSSRLDHDR